MYLGIDIGGTFTDLVLMDDVGRIGTAKALSTPGELEIGVLNAIPWPRKPGVELETCSSCIKTFGHGTTQATNAPDRAHRREDGPVTTQGFGDTWAFSG